MFRSDQNPRRRRPAGRVGRFPARGIASRRDDASGPAPGRFDGRIVHYAEQVVAVVDRDHPADVQLRALFRANDRLTAEDRREISLVVFAYYRWFGWGERETSNTQRIHQALELDRRFQAKPRSVPGDVLVKRAVPHWVRQFLTVTEPWVRALQQHPRLWLRARPGQGESVAEALGEGAERPFKAMPDTLQYQGTKDLFSTQQFRDGAFEIQDLSSQWVSLACAPQPGDQWWDACAGEGGKTLHLAELMGGRGLVWATDRAAWRLAILKKRAARAQVFNYRSALWTGDDAYPTPMPFDGVLVDAPCTGVGTWQRNPHARWTTGPEDVVELSRIQLDLLSRGAQKVKPGGKLVYAVCTMARPETTEVASAFQKRFPDFTPLPTPHVLEPGRPPKAQHWYWPQDHGGNGMFLALWKRAKSTS